MKKVLVFTMLVLAAGLLFSCGPDDPPTSAEVLAQLENGSSGPGPGSSSSGVCETSEEPGQIVDDIFTDPRDCKEYRVTDVDGKIWMIDNLNYSRNNTLGYCYGVDFEDEDSDAPHQDGEGCNDGYGRVYEYTVAIRGGLPQGLCPKGWHIPSSAEWGTILISNVTMDKRAGNYNKNPGPLGTWPLGWNDRIDELLEKSGIGFYWTSSDGIYCMKMLDSDADWGIDDECNTSTNYENYFSIRCVWDD